MRSSRAVSCRCTFGVESRAPSPGSIGAALAAGPPARSGRPWPVRPHQRRPGARRLPGRRPAADQRSDPRRRVADYPKTADDRPVLETWPSSTGRPRGRRRPMASAAAGATALMAADDVATRLAEVARGITDGGIAGAGGLERDVGAAEGVPRAVRRAWLDARAADGGCDPSVAAVRLRDRSPTRSASGAGSTAGSARASDPARRRGEPATDVGTVAAAARRPGTGRARAIARLRRASARDDVDRGSSASHTRAPIGVAASRQRRPASPSQTSWRRADTVRVVGGRRHRSTRLRSQVVADVDVDPGDRCYAHRRRMPADGGEGAIRVA